MKKGKLTKLSEDCFGIITINKLNTYIAEQEILKDKPLLAA